MDPLFLVLLLVILSLPLLLGSRRQRRAMVEAQQLQSSLAVGDRVMTTSGVHAEVVGTDDEATVDLEIAPGVRTTWVRAAIRERLVEPADPAAGAGGATAADPGAVGEDARTDRP